MCKSGAPGSGENKAGTWNFSRAKTSHAAYVLSPALSIGAVTAGSGARPTGTGTSRVLQVTFGHFGPGWAISTRLSFNFFFFLPAMTSSMLSPCLAAGCLSHLHPNSLLHPPSTSNSITIITSSPTRRISSRISTVALRHLTVPQPPGHCPAVGFVPR